VASRIQDGRRKEKKLLQILNVGVKNGHGQSTANASRRVMHLPCNFLDKLEAGTMAAKSRARGPKIMVDVHD
jgi:hypothetical protein